MSVKIIKLPEDREALEIYCKSCSALLSFLPVDVVEHLGTDDNGEYTQHGHRFIVCAYCGQNVVLESW